MDLNISPRGICEVCGKPAYAPQAKKCEEHRNVKQPKRADAVNAAAEGPQPDLRVDKPPAPSDSRTPAEQKSERATQIARAIETELNPAMAQGLAFICQPVPAINFYKEEGDKIVPHHFGERVAFSGLEVWVLSHAAAELEKAPMLQGAKTVAGPVMPIALGIGAAFLIGAKAYGVWHLREDVVGKYKAEQAAEAPGQADHVAATEAAREAETARQQTTVAAEEAAQAAQAAEAEARRINEAPPVVTEPKVWDGDLGDTREPAVEASDLPDIAGAAEAELADAMAGS
jgi:hypothetical protein